MSAESNNDRALGESVTEALNLATEVALEGRAQLAIYTQRVVQSADQIAKATQGVARFSAEEKELLRASTKAASSFADLFIDLAEAAFDEMTKQGEATRSKAMGLARKVTKFAVDASLDSVLNQPPTAASPTASAIELSDDTTSQSLQFLGGPSETITIRARLRGRLSGKIQARATKGKWTDLVPKNDVEFTLNGSSPRLTLRLAPDFKVKKLEVAVLRIKGPSFTRSLALTVRPIVRRR